MHPFLVRGWWTCLHFWAEELSWSPYDYSKEQDLARYSTLLFSQKKLLLWRWRYPTYINFSKNNGFATKILVNYKNLSPKWTLYSAYPCNSLHKKLRCHDWSWRAGIFLAIKHCQRTKIGEVTNLSWSSFNSLTPMGADMCPTFYQASWLLNSLTPIGADMHPTF
jgi:hypothetical protein